MCGFAGYYSSDSYDESVLTAMGDKIAHRGPDAEGYYNSGNVHFAFRRLSIIDLERGNQPMVSPDGKVAIVFNGEIYNYRDLQQELRLEGVDFATNSDTEVLVLGYATWGIEKLLQKIRGMFAFTIWNKETETLIGARDHFGIKPYHYARIGNDLLFGSEIKAFFPYPKFKPEVNTAALKPYLTFQTNPLEESFFKGVFRLKPGTYYTFRNGEMDFHRYFHTEYEYRHDSMENVVSEIEHTVAESVKYHEISDVEVGAFLSAGVDSSYVVSLSRPDNTYSVGFKAEGQNAELFNETSPAHELSKELGINNKYKIISEDEFFDGVPKVQYYCDEPHANLSAVPIYYLSQMAAKDLKVVLSGEGSDELFAGYQTFTKTWIEKLYCILPQALRRKLWFALKDKPHFHGKTFVEKWGRTPEERYVGQAFLFDDDEANAILQPDFQSDRSFRDITKPVYDQVKDRDSNTRMLYLDMNMWLPNEILVKADRMTMANSLELRVPLLDKEVWNTARHIPPRQKLRGTETKYCLRKAAFRHIPEAWAKRKKLGFLVPFVQWIRKDQYYRYIYNEFQASYVDRFFDRDKIMQLLQQHRSGEKNTGRKIYAIYCFLVWYRVFFVDKGQPDFLTTA
ncbi:MAG: asparagine synthase (glutamine-hydrolyzing) [Varibaculum sp.]|nr:asparagine synthase (glutamine-hydrolyzing) [Varibaculum sp.]